MGSRLHRAGVRLAVAALAFLALAGAGVRPAAAVPIHAWTFGSGTSLESFEGLTLGPDVGMQLGFQGVYLPGNGGDYTFASAVTLTGPSIDVFPGDAFVHDFTSDSPPPNRWGATGDVNGPGDVPFGDAYLAVFEAGSREAAIELRFATPQLRVGAAVTGRAGTTITLDVYGAGDVLLESRTVNAVPLAFWGLNFLGIERLEGIVRVVFRGHDFGIDGLAFEEPLQAPEPGSALLLALGLAGLAAFRARRD
jgi:PEP-CTERM motif